MVGLVRFVIRQSRNVKFQANKFWFRVTVEDRLKKLYSDTSYGSRERSAALRKFIEDGQIYGLTRCWWCGCDTDVTKWYPYVS